MEILFTALIIIVALLLVIVVLIQNSKGGGLASNVGISNQMMGVKKTTDFIEKATWYLVGALVILCLGSGFAFRSSKSANDDGGLAPEIGNIEVPVSPTAPTTTPVNP